MDSQNGLGRELLWGLLACQHQLISREDLADALQAWLSKGAVPLKPILKDRLGMDAGQMTRVDTLEQDFLAGKTSSPFHVLQSVGLRQVLESVLERVGDPRFKASLQSAAVSIGIGTPPPDGMTMGVSPAELIGAVEAAGQLRHPEPSSSQPNPPEPNTSNLSTPELTDPEESSELHTTLLSTVRDPGETRPSIDPSETRSWTDRPTDGVWPPPPGQEPSGVHGPHTEAGSRSPLRYRILRPHAQGGLGAVFVAHDEELHREVALKEILERHAHITENRLRFLLEAEVTGGLEHPGIVPVHGLGQYEDGRPYYAMRFIRGTSLKTAIATFHAADTQGRDPTERALSLRRLLTHFIDVCEAIAYAHSRGVLHRDLKPANVMLGKFGETLVVDWGLAKPLLRCFPQNDDAPAALKTVLDPAEELTLSFSGAEGGPPTESGAALGPVDTLREQPLIPPSLGKSTETVAGTRVGTPAFMSPEQAAGHVDRLGPASDTYSLGATLYNILTGKSPFTGSDLTRTLARVIEGDFPAPRKANASVPRPLEAIVLKAMALKPEHRYASPKALRDDIEHWMADEPVSAYRDPPLARLARWARRHKTLVASSTALLLAAVVALSAGSVLLERERARTDRERALALKNYGYAYEAAETMLSRVGDVDLADIPQMEPVRLELLKTARLQFDKLLEQKSNDPEIHLLESRTRARLGDVLEMMGQYTGAEQNYNEAISSLLTLERRMAGDDRPLRARARAEHGLGVMLRKLNRFREAESWLRDAVTLREQLVARSPDDRALQQSLSDSRYYLGALLARLASPSAEDRKLYDQAIKDQEALLSVDPGEPENRINLARYLNNLAILEARSDPAKAENRLRKVQELLTGLNAARASLPAARWQAARASNNLGNLLESKGQHHESEKTLKHARDALDRLTAEFPRILQYRRELASIFNNLGRVGRDTRQMDLAIEAYRQAADQLKEMAQGNPQVPDYQEELDIALVQLGLLQAEANKAAGEETLARVLADQEKLIAAYPAVPDYRNALGRSLREYANLLRARGEASRAADLAEKAEARVREALKGDSGNRVYAKNLTEALTLQILIAEKAKQTEKVGLLVDRLVEAPTADLRNHLTAAMGLTRCLVITSTDEALAPDVREKRAEEFGRRAVAILRQAANRGLLLTSDPLRDEEFLLLRTRPDFIELFKELRDRQTPATG
jgi:serine/threonine-protein kinase